MHDLTYLVYCHRGATCNARLYRKYYAEPKKKTTNKTKLNNAKNQTKEFIGGLKNINVLACRLSVRQIFDVESMLLFQLNLNLTLDQCYIFNV